MEIVAHHRRPGRAQPWDPRAILRRGLAAGPDRIELDVLLYDGRLIVAHDVREARRRPCLTLEEALAVLDGFPRLLLDVKGADAARPLGCALAGARPGPDTIVCGDLTVAEHVGQISGASRAWTLPTERGATPAVPAGWFGLATARARRRIELAAVGALGAHRCDAVTVDRRFVTATLAAAVRGTGGDLLVWTVDDADEVRRFAQLGACGLVTNHPGRARRALAGPDRGQTG